MYFKDLGKNLKFSWLEKVSDKDDLIEKLHFITYICLIKHELVGHYLYNYKVFYDNIASDPTSPHQTLLAKIFTYDAHVLGEIDHVELPDVNAQKFYDKFMKLIKHSQKKVRFDKFELKTFSPLATF